MPLIRDYTEATALEDTDAFVLDRVGVGTMFIEAASLSGGPYIASFEFFGLPPASDELLGGHAFQVAVRMDAGFAGAVGHCEVAPTAAFTATAYQISGGVATSIGSMAVSVAGDFTFSLAADTTFARNDSIKFVGPTIVDASLANFWWTLVGTRA